MAARKTLAHHDPMLPLTPTKLGRYEIVDEIGKGAMGIVYLARDPLIGRLVALKTFRIGYSVKDQELEQFRARFRREAQVLAKIAHPAIIQIYEIVGSDEDSADPYIVMEYFDGRPLDAVVKDGPLPAAQVMAVVRQCAEGLRKAHANNVVHRDIKPGNLMMSASGEVKILDFGIAKLRDSKQNLTGETVLGTPFYMSPEQATGYGIDGRSDLYSLGITAFHLITGRKPFEARSKVDVMLMQVKSPLPSITDLTPCDARVVAIVEKMCAKKPAERYQTCDELIAAVDALPRALGGKQGEAPPQPEKTRVLPTPTRSPPPAQPARARPQERRPARSRPWLGAVLGVAAGLLLIAGGAFAVLRHAAASRGRIPQDGWVSRGGLRKVQAKGGYGNCVFSTGDLPGDGAALATAFSAADPIHGRCFFSRPVGANTTGQVWEELWVDGRKRAHVIFDPALPQDAEELVLDVGARHAARLRDLPGGSHTLDLWIYRQADGGDSPVPLAAGELLVRK